MLKSFSNFDFGAGDAATLPFNENSFEGENVKDVDIGPPSGTFKP